MLKAYALVAFPVHAEAVVVVNKGTSFRGGEDER